MTEPQATELEQRVARLERMVEELLRRADAAGTVGRPAPAASPARASATGAGAQPPVAAPARETPVWRKRFWDGEFWLNKLGIGLVLLGVTFLFFYSIEQGWITPEVRVGFGAAVGVLLLGAGLRIGEQKRSFAQVLLGGGIGTFYIVGFAAFQLYALLGYHTAFAFMVGVTALAFALAVKEDHPALALIGLKGALGTPFLLYRGDGDLVWLVSYTALVMTGAVALFLHREWRSLVWTGALGGWAVLLIGYGQSLAASGSGTDAERWVMQGTILFGWTLFGLVVPAWEAWVAGKRGASADAPDGTRGRALLRLHLHALAAITPLAAFGLSAAIWTVSSERWGWGMIAAGIAYAGAFAALRGRHRDLAEAQLFAAFGLLAVGAICALTGETLFVGLALLAWAAHAAARRIPSRWQATVGHLLAVSVAMWFIVRLDSSGIPGTVRALGDPLVITALLLAAREVTLPIARVGYRLACHIAILGLLWRELAYLPGGAGLVSGAWGTYSVLLLAAGAHLRNAPTQKVAIATILALVAKLFLVDLAALEAIWRILLFLGLGGVLLLSSYALQGVWRSAGSMWSDR